MDTTSLSLRSSIFRIGIASALTLAASGLLASCNGGDDDSGMGDEVTPPATLAGSWNLFLDGTSCDGDTFTATPLEIIEVAEDDFTLRIGEIPLQFEFSGQRADNMLMVEGISTANGVTLELDPTTLFVSGNGHRLSGPVMTTRTVDGVACTFTGEFEAFEIDATQDSLVRGDWEWAARTSAVNGSCTSVGEVQAFDVTLFPKRQSQFFLDLGLPSGERVQFDASISAARLNFFGTDTLANGDEIRIAPGSFLIIEPGGVAGSGEISVMITGSDPCDYTATLTGQRPSIGMPLLPFVRDVEGTQTLVGIRPEDPSETVVLVESLDSESLGAGATTADAARFAELVERTVPGAGGDGAVMRDGMFYTAGGDIFFVDLAQRFDVNGGRIVLPPVRVFTGNGSAIDNLSVFVDRSRSTTVVVADRANDRFLIEFGIIAPTIASALLNGSTEVLGMLMDTDGQFRGMAIQTAAGDELRRISVAQSSELIATGVTAAAVSPGGAVYYARLGQLAVVDAGETVPTVLQTAAGTSYTIGRFEGERAFMTAEDTAGASILSREPGGPLVSLAQTGSVGAGGAAFSDLVPVGDRVVFAMNGGSGTRRIMAVPKDGGMFELLVPFPESDEYDPDEAQALGATAYFSGTSAVFGLDPTNALPPEELANASLGAPLVADAFTAPGVRNLEAITLVGANGELSVLRRTEPANGPLSGAVMFFSASTQDAELVLAPMGAQLLFSDRDPSQAADQFAPLYWVDLLSGGAPLLVSGEAGELNLPVR